MTIWWWNGHYADVVVMPTLSAWRVCGLVIAGGLFVKLA
jgi:hypothetical protein